MLGRDLMRGAAALAAGALVVLCGLLLGQAADARRIGPSGAALLGGGAAIKAPSEVQVLGSQIGSGNGSDNVGSINLLSQSNQFDNPGWVKTFLAVTPGQSDPASGATAFGLTEQTGGCICDIRQPINKAASALAYTLQVQAKQGLRTRLTLLIGDWNTDTSNGVFAVINLATCTQGVAATTFGTGFTSPSATFASSTNGFCKATLTVTSNSTAGLYGTIRMDNGSGTGALSQNYLANTSGIAVTVYQMQLEQAASASAYVNVTSDGQPIANLTNGLYGSPGSTWWDSPTSQGWAGVDAGLGNTPIWTRWRFVSRPDSLTSDSASILAFPHLMSGATIQTSSDPTFAVDGAVADTVSSEPPGYPRYWLTERALALPTQRAVRFKSAAGSFGALAQLQFFAQRSSIGTAAASPVQPVISPASWRGPNGSTTITMSSRTNEAKIYYTTDGSTPTNASASYSGPFSLNMGGVTTTVKAIAYDATLATPSSPVTTAVVKPWAFKPNDDWYDTRGILIEAHGGGLFGPVNGLFYFVGYNCNLPQMFSPSQGIPRIDNGVWLYSSPDLYNWTFVGNILPFPPGSFASAISLTRMHILFNASTNKYVLWSHVGDISLTTSSAAVATASAITGPWTWQNTNLTVDGVVNGFHDFNLFLDDDGVTAYVIYATGNGITISQLASDYLSTTGTNKLSIPAYAATTQEAPVLFKRSGVYFVLAGLANPYDSTANIAQNYVTNSGVSPTANSWSASTTLLFASSQTGTQFNGQPTLVLKMPSGNYLFGGDFWVHNPFYNSRYVWLPLTFPTSTSVQAQVPSTWDIIGTWGAY